MEVVEITVESGPVRRTRIDVLVGLLVTLAATACLALVGTWAARRLGPGGGYELTADFASVGGLPPLAAVEIAGVPVGTVTSIALRHGAAHTVFHLDASVQVPADSSVAIKTEGLTGETYVAIEPGRSDTHLAPGGRIRRTVSAIDLEDVIAARIFGEVP
jgi:virulence factor Mce-like protein